MTPLDPTKSIPTPWGPSHTLRAKRLTPGPGLPREMIARNQRSRLHGATVAVIDELGYDGLSVAAIAARAGVSRSAVYKHFGGTQDCFLATFDVLIENAMAAIARAYRAEDAWDRRLHAVLEELVDLVVEQPAAARLCFLEIYACGPAIARSAEATSEIGRMAAEAIASSPERADIPVEVITATLGGLRTILESRLRTGAQSELPELIDELLRWLLSYRTPAIALTAAEPVPRRTERFIPTFHVERLFVALAEAIDETGYQGVTMSDLAGRASVSLSTFYENFASKEEAFLAACDAGVAQAFHATRLAYASQSDWPLQIRAAIRELLAFMSAEPEWTRLAVVEVMAAGPRAQARRDRAIEMFTHLLEPGRELAPDIGKVTLEAIGGSVYALMYDQIRNHGSDRLPEILPAATFILLSPFVGSDRAAEIAGGHS